MTGGRSPVIRTPDQRIRVFVSSTLRELADERDAVRVGDRAPATRARDVRAGRPPAPAARPLPVLPRAERRLRRHLRRQLRLGRPRRGGLRPRGRVQPRRPRRCRSSSTSRTSDTRDERLTQLIARIQADDTAAYLHFHTADDLEDQVAGDLAMLLAERFDESRHDGAPSRRGRHRPRRARVPGAVHRRRSGARASSPRSATLLAGGTDRVVSLDRPRRHRQEPARDRGRPRRRATSSPTASTSCLLEGVLEPGLLLPTIAYVLGVRDTGAATLEERIARRSATAACSSCSTTSSRSSTRRRSSCGLYTLAPRA